MTFIPSFDLSSNVTAGIAFLTGLVAAFSSCAALVGGFVIGIPARFHTAFNVGRIISYTVLGGVLGALGSKFTISARISAIIILIASVAMILLAFRLLNIFGALTRWAPNMPRWIWRHVPQAEHASTQPRSFLLGAATFFLPCGFTQALQLYVIASGSAFHSALIMSAFSLGTLPGLLSIAALKKIGNPTWQKLFSRVAGVVVLIIGITSARNAAILAGVLSRPMIAVQGQQSVLNANQQVVTMAVNGLTYSPSSFTIRRGMPVLWRVDGTRAQGCAHILTIPQLGFSKYLSPGMNEMTFTPIAVGTLTFTCSMGMAGPGQFNVID